MPKSRYSLQRPRAARQFTDREEFIAAFDRCVKEYDYDRHQILVFYGIGGIGKTRLQKHLIERLQEQQDDNVLFARLDFEDTRFQQITPALRYLRGQLPQIPFYSFDSAFAVYWRKANPDLPLNEENFKLIENSDVLVSLLDLCGDIPFVDLIPKIGMAAAKTSRKAQSWWNNRGKEELRGLHLMEVYDIERMLPAFFASDVTHFMREQQKKVVLFLDTYEAMWIRAETRTEGQFFAKDEWLRDLVNEGQGILWCIGGREWLRWEERYPEWGGLLQQHLVGSLSDEDATRFLKKAGLTAPEFIEAIVETAEGVPFYLDLALDSWEEASKHEEPRLDDFHVNQQELFARFMKYLDDREQETLKVLSVPRRFDRRLFEELIEEFKTGYLPTRFQELMRFSFIMPDERENSYSLHDLMRSNLHSIMDREIALRVHQFLFDRYNPELADTKISLEHRMDCLEEALYHSRHCKQPEETASWFFDKTNFFIFNEPLCWEELVSLYQEALAYLRDALGSEHPGTVTALNNLAYILGNMARYSEAEVLYQEALRIRREVLGETHSATLTTLNNFGALLMSQGRFVEAEPLFRNVLTIVWETLNETHPDVAISMNNLALLLQKSGRFSEAEPLFRKALYIRRAVLGETNRYTAQSMNNLATLLQITGRFAEAKSLYRDALNIYREVLGEMHPDSVQSLDNLAVLFSKTGCFVEAESLFRKALHIRREVLGEMHPHTAESLNNLAALFYTMERFAEAEPLFLEALHIRKEVLGEMHPHTTFTLYNLAELLCATKRFSEAEPLLREALRIQRDVLGETLPDIASSLNNLAGLLQNTGRTAEAETLYLESLLITEKVHGVLHPDTALLYWNIANFWIEQSTHFPLAFTLILMAQRIWRHLLGAEHPRTQMALSFLQEHCSPEQLDALQVSQPPDPAWKPFSASDDWPPSPDSE